MSRHVYGIFDTKARACAAYNELAQRHGEERCSVLIHEDHVDEGEVTLGQTHVVRGATAGAAIIGLAGVSIGLIAGPAGLLGVGPLAAAVFVGGIGSVYGAIVGAIAGASEADADRFEELLHEGKVIVAADPCHATDVPAIEDTLREYGGAVAS